MPDGATGRRRDVEAMLAFHGLSGLDPERPGAMPRRLERRSQPIPFRRFAGAPRLLLPLSGADAGADSGGPKADPEASPPAFESVARLLEDSLALTGWKRKANAGFGLRAVPSAGNLHPLEAYLVASNLEGGKGEDGAAIGSAALYHYSPFDHALERRRHLPEGVWQSLRKTCPGAEAFLVLTAIYWRCSWKYGERAFRLAHLDAGHALAALDAAAALADLRVRWIDSTDDDLRRLLGGEDPSPADAETADPEAEDALCLLAVEPRRAAAVQISWRPQDAIRALLEDAPLVGAASRISQVHRRWPGLLAAARTSRRRGNGPPAPGDVRMPQPAVWPRDVLRRRRSRAVYGDRKLDRRSFVEMIESLVGAESSLPWPSDLTVLLCVHRVAGVESGLYAARGASSGDERLRAAMCADFEWRQIAAASRGCRLFLLAGGDARRAAAHLAGDQPAAGDGAFTAIFLGRLEVMRRDGAWAYRRLHWQAGELGHRLYLEAETRHLGATGLGGFYDERLRALLCLDRDHADDWRPLYMVAVGFRGSDDAKLEAPYAHRGRGAVPVPASRGGFRIPAEAVAGSAASGGLATLAADDAQSRRAP